MEMLFSVHIFPRPPNAAHARPILRLTSPSHRPSSVIDQSSQIDKSCDLLQHPCSQSHLQFLMLFSYCHRFCFFLHLSLVPLSCCSYPLYSSGPAGSPSCLPSGQCHRQNGGCLVVYHSYLLLYH